MHFRFIDDVAFAHRLGKATRLWYKRIRNVTNLNFPNYPPLNNATEVLLLTLSPTYM